MISEPITSRHMQYCLLLLGGMIAVIGSALAFEHIGGYIPCKLCLQQRIPWYAGIPVMLIATGIAWRGGPPKLIRGLLLLAAVIMVISLYLGVDHSGVEWGWWLGPGDCGAVEGGISNDTGNFLQQLEEAVPPSCDEAPLRVFGLSFAGWNAAMSFLAALFAFKAAFAK